MLSKLKRKPLRKAKAESQSGERAGSDDSLVVLSFEEQHKAARQKLSEADPFAYQSAHRRMVALFKISAGLNVILGVGLVIALQAIAVVLPLKTTEIALLRVDPNDDRIYAVEPISVEVDGFELMLEKIARRYVALLLSVDPITQNKRFEEVRRYSDSTYFNAFLKDNESRIKQAIEDGLNRSITIESANKVDAYEGVFQYSVDFIQTDALGTRDREQVKLRAYLEMTTRPEQVSAAERFENPLGIRILDLVVKERPTT